MASMTTSIVGVREQAFRDPFGGAKALSDGLANRPEWTTGYSGADLKRADLKRIQHSLDLFVPNPAYQASGDRAVYFLLSVCLELAHQL